MHIKNALKRMLTEASSPTFLFNNSNMGVARIRFQFAMFTKCRKWRIDTSCDK